MAVFRNLSACLSTDSRCIYLTLNEAQTHYNTKMGCNLDVPVKESGILKHDRVNGHCTILPCIWKLKVGLYSLWLWVIWPLTGQYVQNFQKLFWRAEKILFKLPSTCILWTCFVAIIVTITISLRTAINKWKFAITAISIWKSWPSRINAETNKETVNTWTSWAVLEN